MIAPNAISVDVFVKFSGSLFLENWTSLFLKD